MFCIISSVLYPEKFFTVQKYAFFIRQTHVGGFFCAATTFFRVFPAKTCYFFCHATFFYYFYRAFYDCLKNYNPHGYENELETKSFLKP